MHIYLPGQSASSRQHQKQRRRRYSAEQWSCLRGVIDREHRSLALVDPRSPRIKPTLGTVGLVLR